ncbi:MAG: 3'(2'),5'-bisphosphate nucleotidase CysQ [Aureispira sp.]|nr:3'(2'),5'-bisphosphate nucleotidase CysQ [Aureispira sp.]
MLDIQKVCAIAKEAGAKILDIYHNASDIDIQRKDDDSPLTIADKAAHNVICAGLEILDPKYPILSEESTDKVAYEIRKNYDYYWLVDPLDGTKEFIKRNGEFTVNIALIHQNRAVAGVVYAPCLDEMYWAEKGKGAFLEKDGEAQQINAATYTMQDEGLNVVCSRSHLNTETQAFVDELNAPDLVATGSSLKFLLLATGKAHLYPRIAPTMEWDTAAAQIVLEESGGKVIQYKKTEEVVYNKENLLNPFFVAYGNVVD